MKRERDEGVNGIKIFRDLCRDYLDASKEGLVALGQRVIKPVRADLDSFEDRLRTWEEDVERLNRITGSDVQDSLKPVYLEDLMPTAIKPRYDLEKHNLRTYGKLKEFYDRMILEHKTQKASQRSRGLLDLEERGPEVAAKLSDGAPEDHFLFSLLLPLRKKMLSRLSGLRICLPSSAGRRRAQAKEGGIGGKGVLVKGVLVERDMEAQEVAAPQRPQDRPASRRRQRQEPHNPSMARAAIATSKGIGSESAQSWIALWPSDARWSVTSSRYQGHRQG